MDNGLASGADATTSRASSRFWPVCAGARRRASAQSTVQGQTISPTVPAKSATSRVKRQSVHLGGGGNPAIRRAHGSAYPLASRDQTTPRICRRRIDPHQTAGEPSRQVVAQPVVQPVASPTRRQPIDAATEFGQGDDAQEHRVVVVNSSTISIPYHSVNPPYPCTVTLWATG